MECEVEAETFQRQALEIREPGTDFDPTAAPQTGEEFLMHMLYERKRCPAVVVRPPKTADDEVETKEMETTVSVPYLEQKLRPSTPPASLLPTKEWKAVQAADFEHARACINLLRQKLDEQQYDNALEPPLTTDATEWRNFCCNNSPVLHTILRLNQRSLEQLLEHISDWLSADEAGEEEDAEDAEELPANVPEAAVCPPAAATAVDLGCSEEWLGSWLYAVLACLHLPIEPAVHSTLRDIARSCMRLRSHLLPEELEKASPYNLFIYIIAKVFDQLDLAAFV